MMLLRFVNLLKFLFFINSHANGLVAFKNISGPQVNEVKKHFQNIFCKNNLSIIVKCYLKTTDYLDVILNLSFGLYKPFHKSNSEINDIHKELNHPPGVI